MKSILLAFILLVSATAVAADDVKFSFNNEELSKIVETYSKASGQKFVVDPGVHGKATILLPGAVSLEEAFNQLSSALAVNGFGISKQGDTMVIMSARNIQRNLIETTTNVPSLKPERMVTYIVTLKNVSVDDVNRNVRILPSKDGEMTVLSDRNQILITDWSSNIQRVAEILKTIDQKASPEVAKIVEQNKKNLEKRRAHQGGKKPHFKPAE